MFVNAIVKVKKHGEPWRMHTAWLDRATGTDRICYWVHAPSVCPCDWGTWETLSLDGKIVPFEIVEHWAEDFQPQEWAADEKHEMGVIPRRHGLEVSLQDSYGFSFLSLNPKQAREMSAYLAAWAETHGE